MEQPVAWRVFRNFSIQTSINQQSHRRLQNQTINWRIPLLIIYDYLSVIVMMINFTFIIERSIDLFHYHHYIYNSFKFLNIWVRLSSSCWVMTIIYRYYFIEFLVRYYIELNQIDQSEDCLKLFSIIDSSSHQFYYFRGLIVNARRQHSLAKQFFNDALAINPNHFPTLIQLTKLLIEFGNYSLAEKYARDAIALQPSNHQPWSVVFQFLFLHSFTILFRYLLSLSMEARGEYQQSIDVSATAVQLEEDSPIISYNSIVRVL